jgi:chorismate synthase
MAGNTFGELFRLTTFGESHGPGIGGVIDGCPAGLTLDLDGIRRDLHRRKPGQSKITTSRSEADDFEILSGLYQGKTTGTPIGFLIRNMDYKPSDYEQMESVYRPSHADFVYDAKYGFRDPRGGGRSSARETASRVLGGAIAKQLIRRLQTDAGGKEFRIDAYVSQVGGVSLSKTYEEIDFNKIDSSIVRCPDGPTAEAMIREIETARGEGDTVGGVITCVIRNTPAGLGEPVFDKLQADLAKAVLSINAAHGFEYGSGFQAASMRGSAHNDRFVASGGKIATATNRSGGIQGGISNGMDIYFRVAFKPVSTLMQQQKTLDQAGREAVLEPKGRHDPCVVPRAVPIVEAMAALVLADHYLRNKNSKITSP